MREEGPRLVSTDFGLAVRLPGLPCLSLSHTALKLYYFYLKPNWMGEK